MKKTVKALRNVKDANGWHHTGEVFATDEDLGDAVKVLSAREKPEPEPEKEPEQASEQKGPDAEPEKEAPKPKSPARRRKVSE